MTERRIPTHLLGLPRDPETGWPVPYVNRWTSENEHQATVGTWLGSPAFMWPDHRGVGAADFRSQHLNRQRIVMRDHSCQVCRADRATLLIIGPGLSGQRIRYGRAGLPVTGVAFTEPLICSRCATFATEHCPGLIRRRRTDTMRIVDLHGKLGRTELVYSTGTHDLIPGRVALMWAKLVVPVQMLGVPADWFPEWVAG